MSRHVAGSLGAGVSEMTAPASRFPVPSDEAERLAALEGRGLLDTDPERGFDDLVELARDLCGCPMAAISLVDRDRQWFKARRGLSRVETPREESFCTYSILEHDVTEVPDALDDPRFVHSSLVTGDPHLRFYAGAPLRTRDGHALGTLCVLDTEPHALTDDQRRHLEALAEQVMDQIDLRQALRALEASEKRFRRLVEQNTNVSALLDEHGEVLYVSDRVDMLIGRPAEDLLGVNAFHYIHTDDLATSIDLLESAILDPGDPKRGRIRARDEEGRWRQLDVVATSYLDDPDLQGVVVNVDDVTDIVTMTRALEESDRTFSALVGNSSDIMVVLDTDRRIRFASTAVHRLLGHPVEDVIGRRTDDFVDPAHHARVGAVLTRENLGDPDAVELRLRHADGSFRWFESRGVDLTGDEAIGGILVNLRDIEDRKHYEEQLARRTLTDDLTGLPNRTLLDNRVDHALARARDERSVCALLFIDLDRFKLVNESAGHEVGDNVLREVAGRIRDNVDAADTVARFGGDEFAVLCEDVRGIDDAVAIAARLHDQLDQPVAVGEHQLTVSASIGIALSDGREHAATLLQASDTALHVAKERGRGRTEVFEESLRAQVVDKLDLLVTLQAALEKCALDVAYQPLIRLADRRVVGAEALVRWQHPERGSISPGAFISLAEEAGLIGHLGDQVLEQAATQAARWSGERPGCFVTVNVSSHQLADPGFAESVLATLHGTETEPGVVVLEITESADLGRTGPSRTNLHRLEEAGVRVAVDDFGTGYSSLATLQDVGADLLKIDGSFVEGLADRTHGRALVGAIVGLGRALGMTVVAEHVETEEQAAAVTELGCDLAQGFLFGAPGPPEAFLAALGDDW